MPGTIVNPIKDLICINSNHILIDFVTDSLQYHGWAQNLHLITITAHFCISILFHWVTIVPILLSKANKQLTFIILFTNNFSLKTLPRTRDSERDLWLYWAWQQVTRWHASRSTIWAWRPFPLNFKSDTVSNKNVIYLNYLNL